MRFYFFTIFCFISLCYVFYITFCYVTNPPKELKNKIFSKSKLAIWLYEKVKSRITGNDEKIIIFHEVAFWIHLIIFICSLVVCFIDISMSFAISDYLKSKGLISLMSFLILGTPYLFLNILEIIWKKPKIKYEK